MSDFKLEEIFHFDYGDNGFKFEMVHVRGIEVNLTDCEIHYLVTDARTGNPVPGVLVQVDEVHTEEYGLAWGEETYKSDRKPNQEYTPQRPYSRSFPSDDEGRAPPPPYDSHNFSLATRPLNSLVYADYALEQAIADDFDGTQDYAAKITFQKTAVVTDAAGHDLSAKIGITYVWQEIQENGVIHVKVTRNGSTLLDSDVPP